MSNGRDWFRALIDEAPDVYFRYAFTPERRFAYVSPAIEKVTGFTPDAFYADPAFCLPLVVRQDRTALKQIVRARRSLILTIRVTHRDGTIIPLELRTVPVTTNRHVAAVEGVARPVLQDRAATPSLSDEPTQQRLASLMYEVHDLLHRFQLPAASSPATSQLVAGDIVLDQERLTVTLRGEPVMLTTREVLVLRYLLHRPGRIVTREQLLTDVWGYRYTGDHRTVDVHISRLRRKLPALRDVVVAVKHVGYRVAELPEVKARAI